MFKINAIEDIEFADHPIKGFFFHDGVMRYIFEELDHFYGDNSTTLIDVCFELSAWDKYECAAYVSPEDRWIKDSYPFDSHQLIQQATYVDSRLVLGGISKGAVLWLEMTIHSPKWRFYPASEIQA